MFPIKFQAHTSPQERWDYTRPTCEDQKQWDESAKRWLNLTLAQRQPYHEMSSAPGILFPGDPGLPTQQQITRVLQPHQTIQERHLGVFPGGERTIALRTCYAPELNDVYQDMSWYLSDSVVDIDGILDNETLYASDAGWEHILTRIPSLCDADRWNTLDELPWERDDDDRLPETHHGFPLDDASYREVIMVYLLDRQALEEKLFTVMWLDNFGECVWWYRIAGENLQDLTGWLASTGGLMGMLETADGEEEGKENGVYAKGTVIDWF